MSLNADALTTTAHARLHIKRKIDADIEPELVDILINTYSKAIHRYCEREFVATDSLSRSFSYTGGGIMSLAPYDLRSVTSIAISGFDTTTETLDASDYQLTPIGKTTEDTYYTVQFRTRHARQWGGYTVVVVGNWGMATVPDDVEDACLIAVTDGYRNPEGFASRAVGGLEYSEVAEPSEAPARSLPLDARNLLLPFKRIHM